MSQIKNQLRNPIVQQYLIEILFPIVGYYLFGWSIVLIALYYLIDYLVSIVMFFRRLIAINNVANQPISLLSIVGSTFVFLILFSVVIGVFFKGLTLSLNIDSAELSNQIYDAFINELWFLTPLVFILYIFKDRFTFYIPRRFLNFHNKRYLFVELIKSFIIFFGLILFFFFVVKFHINQAWFIPIFVLLKVSFDLVIKLLLTKRTLKL